ncbi:hypothetical protein Ciccas_000036 [Cichlidogyrus casuarinus]|uniref:PHD-type domain-containing protein n=1 Tax=Cichlidogyrus casuarinus TaxID=1844966 RepID=A0ABD2QP35_9PLAT
MYQLKKLAKIIPICCYCLGDEKLNKTNKVAEKMIACWACGTCAHPSCMKMSEQIFKTVQSLKWFCLNCKHCSICHRANKTDKSEVQPSDAEFLLCDKCDRGYHMTCIDPTLDSPPPGSWFCPICDRESASSPIKSKVSSEVDAYLTELSIAEQLSTSEFQQIRSSLEADNTVHQLRGRVGVLPFFRILPGAGVNLV